MAESRAKLDWAQTAELLAVLYNANRDPKRRPRPYRSSDFNPFAERTAEDDRPDTTKITPENVGLLKAAFNGMPQKPI